ncbi:low temperature requirement protein A [Streptococcus sp. sy004]|uniref:low temperature requirement protein A n=1 Tax=Streptococcus sp. sy004 TaxID=2600149 RepID=UPI001646F0FE|nr:low temperature requirement protein A [Streptococcus sp. sy004]
MPHKKVEFTELFFDLVFVYALSKSTNLIHHLEGGVISLGSFLTFLWAMIILINTWIHQTLFTNRYGQNSLKNLFIMLINMGILLLISNSFTTDWESNFVPFSLMVGTLSISLFIQYFLEYRHADKANQEVITVFLKTLGLRIVFVFVGVLLPYEIGINIYSIGMIISIIFPLFYRKQAAAVPVNFPHLVERLSLIVIIALGEMIISGAAPFMTKEHLSWSAILNFAIIGMIFLYYFGEMDLAVDESRETLGMKMVYLHYPIIMSIGLITVSLSFLAEKAANPYFVFVLFYLGLASFYGSMLCLGHYNKPHLQFSSAYVLKSVLIFLTSAGISLWFIHDSLIVLLSVFLMGLALVQLFMTFYQSQEKRNKMLSLEK